MHRRRSACRAKIGVCSHASRHAPGVEPRPPGQDLPPKKPRERPGPLRPSRERHDYAHRIRRPAIAWQQIVGARQPHQHVASNPPRANRATAWAKGSATTSPGETTSEQHISVPDSINQPPENLIMQPTAQTTYRRPRRDTKMGLVPQEPPPHRGIEDPREVRASG